MKSALNLASDPMKCRHWDCTHGEKKIPEASPVGYTGTIVSEPAMIFSPLFGFPLPCQGRGKGLVP